MPKFICARWAICEDSGFFGVLTIGCTSSTRKRVLRQIGSGYLFEDKFREADRWFNDPIIRHHERQQPRSTQSPKTYSIQDEQDAFHPKFGQRNASRLLRSVKLW